MKKKKRFKTVIIVLVLLAGIGVGGYYGVRHYMASRAQNVPVTPVSMLNGADWIQYYNDTSTYGTVVSDVSQQIYVPSEKVVNEVFVEQGDEVKVGDKLLSYDTTLLELDKELQDLTVQELDLEIESAEADLKKLKNTTPVAASQREPADFVGPDFSAPEEDDDTMASMIPADRNMLASQDLAQSAAETAGVQPIAETASEAVQPIAETAGEAVQPIAETAGDAVQPAADNGAGQPADGTTDGAGQPADGTTDGAGQPADGTTDGAGQPTDGTTDGAGQPTDGTTDGAGQPADGTTDGAGQPADGTTDGAGQPTDGTTDGAGQPADGTIDGAGQPTDGTTDGADAQQETEEVEQVLQGGDALPMEDFPSLPVDNGNAALGEPDRPRMNQSLLDFFSRVCVKETRQKEDENGEAAGEEEVLLLDTDRQEEESAEVMRADLTGTAAKVILHFQEKPDAHFAKLNTYTMRIRGITLAEDKAGILYALPTAEDAEKADADPAQAMDAMEIGGFTLIQDEERNDVVHLTLAFHSGLEEAHAVSPELADVYAELNITADELVNGALTFRTKAKENDVDIQVVSAQPGAAATTGTDGSETNGQESSADGSETNGQGSGTDGNGTDGQGSGTDSGTDGQGSDTDGSETDGQGSGTDGSETDGQGSGTEGSETDGQENGTESEAGTETETETETDVEVLAANLVFDVTWYHGTNMEKRWPDALDIRFYEKNDTAQETPLWSVTLTGSTDLPEDETETDTGEMEPAIEPETEAPEMPSDGAENGAEDLMDEMGEALEEDAQEAQSEDSSEETDALPGTVTQIIPSEENSFSKTHWISDPFSWPIELRNPENYTMVVTPHGSLSYIPRIEWSNTDAGGLKTCSIFLTYLEPEESPLIKLEPLEELDYWSGEGGRYYKGSGTKEDPFVFFCIDGATIKSSFVNWVMGFNEDGTERVKEFDGTERMGYYVVLEIRESDSITGAFIRSVSLDGTIRMDYGFAPNVYWIFSSDTGMVRYEEEVDDPMEDMGDVDWGDIGEGYTAEELAVAIADKEREIRRLNLSKKEAEMKLRQYEKEMEQSTVVSSVDGYVESIDGNIGGSRAYMVVNSQGGLYLQTTVSELNLDSVEKGDVLTATSWQTQNQFTATITQVDYYPTESQDLYGNSNPNSSSYPVLAQIEDPSGLVPYEMAEVKYEQKQAANTGTKSIYISTAYVRAENGQSYVYIRGEDELLKKQYVRTGGTVNDYVEIKEGLTNEDYIAFPYGKNVKDGAKTEENQDIYY